MTPPEIKAEAERRIKLDKERFAALSLKIGRDTAVIVSELGNFLMLFKAIHGERESPLLSQFAKAMDMSLAALANLRQLDEKVLQDEVIAFAANRMIPDVFGPGAPTDPMKIN